MLDEERLTYSALKMWALECYYEGCRDYAVMEAWPHDQIFGYVDYQFENGFERPVERFMWRVVLLVLSGGWNKNWYVEARNIISEQIEREGIESILVGVPLEESQAFKHDLKILGLM